MDEMPQIEHMVLTSYTSDVDEIGWTSTDCVTNVNNTIFKYPAGNITVGEVGSETFYMQKEAEMSEVKRRIVQVFIVDPEEQIPLENAVLYQGEQKLTDATDQELFFEIGVQELLNEHNKVRVTVVDEEAPVVAGKEAAYLKPACIRDLKMVVVNIATF